MSNSYTLYSIKARPKSAISNTKNIVNIYYEYSKFDHKPSFYTPKIAERTKQSIEYVLSLYKNKKVKHYKDDDFEFKNDYFDQYHDIYAKFASHGEKSSSNGNNNNYNRTTRPSTSRINTRPSTAPVGLMRERNKTIIDDFDDINTESHQHLDNTLDQLDNFKPKEKKSLKELINGQMKKQREFERNKCNYIKSATQSVLSGGKYIKFDPRLHRKSQMFDGSEDNEEEDDNDLDFEGKRRKYFAKYKRQPKPIQQFSHEIEHSDSIGSYLTLQQVLGNTTVKSINNNLNKNNENTPKTRMKINDLNYFGDVKTKSEFRNDKPNIKLEDIDNIQNKGNDYTKVNIKKHYFCCCF